jgi:hypothetical protein
MALSGQLANSYSFSLSRTPDMWIIQCKQYLLNQIGLPGIYTTCFWPILASNEKKVAFGEMGVRYDEKWGPGFDPLGKGAR